MLDVHPPEHAAHTWRDFFIHIATICVGLLIAIGLEQSVEAIHRHHERAELREALNAETLQILHDTERVEVGETVQLQWLQQLESQVSSAARDHHPLTALASHPTISWDIPDDPVYTAAKASSKLSLLSDQEIAAFGEMDGLLAKFDLHYNHMNNTAQTVDTFLHDLDFAQPPNTSGLSSASPADLKQLYTDIVAMQIAARDLRLWGRQARGAATAMSHGERNLRNIETAERQFDKLP